MSTEIVPQVLDEAVETSGLSVCTATRTDATPRRGTVYNPKTFACAEPVWFHPFQDGRYLMLTARHWIDAIVAGGPQFYSDAETVEDASWVIVDPATGATSDQAPIPTLLGSHTLGGAVSRINSLYTVNDLDAPDPTVFIAHHRVTNRGQVILQAEEIVPNIGDIEFSGGIYLDGDWLVLIGVDFSTDYVYRARKLWSRVGETKHPEGQWAYQGTRGWYPDPDELEPLRGPGGFPLIADDGQVTYARLADREWLGVHTDDGVSFYSSRMVDQYWKPAQTIVTQFCYLQPQLNANPAQLPDGVRAAIPYVTTDLIAAGENESLTVGWDLLPVK